MAEVVPMRGRIERATLHPWTDGGCVTRAHERRGVDVEIVEGMDEWLLAWPDRRWGDLDDWPADETPGPGWRELQRRQRRGRRVGDVTPAGSEGG